MKTLKVAVIGLTIGTAHIKDYMVNQNISEIVICDINEVRLNEVGEKFAIAKRYVDYKEMLKVEKPDIVSVCVSNFLHKEVCIECFKAGCHVLCEKPLGRNAKESREIYNASQEYGVKLVVNFNRRYSGEAAALKTAVDNGRLGNIYFAKTHWKRTRGVPWWFPLNNTKEKCGGGAFLDLGVHMLDLALWLCNYPKAKYVLGKTFQAVSQKEALKRGFENFDAEDMGVAMISFENGLMLESEISWASNRETEEDEIYLRLYGDKGGAVLRLGVNEKGFTVLQKDLIVTNKAGTPVAYEIELADTPTVRDAFIQTVLNDTENNTPHNAIAVSEIIDAVYQSSAEGKPVQI